MAYEFYWPVLWQYRGLLLEGLSVTLFLFVVGTILSVVLGVLFGVMGTSRFRFLRVFCEVYVEVNRNTPMVVKLFFLYFGFGLDAYPAALIGLAAHQSAYIAETVRSGIESISGGQLEAALSTGLSRIQAIRRIILPQALVVVIPPLTTQVIETLKNTSVAMTIAIPELTFQIQQIESDSFRGFEAATAATVIYLAVAVSVAFVAIGIERWLLKRRSRVGSVSLSPQVAATP